MLGQQEPLTNAYGLIAVGFTHMLQIYQACGHHLISFPLLSLLLPPSPPSSFLLSPSLFPPLLSSRERLQVQSQCYAVLLVKHWAECLR